MNMNKKLAEMMKKRGATAEPNVATAVDTAQQAATSGTNQVDPTTGQATGPDEAMKLMQDSMNMQSTEDANSAAFMAKVKAIVKTDALKKLAKKGK